MGGQRGRVVDSLAQAEQQTQEQRAAPEEAQMIGHKNARQGEAGFLR